MPAIVSNSEAEAALREILAARGFNLSRQRTHGETGVDIVGRNGSEEFHIEVIGYKSSPPARAKDFFESFFRSVSRLKDGAETVVIALVKNWKSGLPQRASQYGVAWQRIGVAFPELQIWIFDPDTGDLAMTPWNSWLNK